jgi:hypothetical protein
MPERLENRIERLSLEDRATLQPSTWDADARTLDVLVYGGEAVQRGGFWTDPYMLQFALQADAVDLSRLNSGTAPLTNGHVDYSDTAALMGSFVAGSVKLGADGLTGKVRLRDVSALSPDNPLRMAVDAAAAGDLRNVSMDVEILSRTIEEREGDLDLHTATRWQPMAAAMVLVGASASAQTLAANHGAGAPQKETQTMDQTRTPDAPAPVVDLAKVREEAAREALAAEKARREALTATAAKLKLAGAEVEALLNDSAVTVEQGRERLIDLAAAKADATAGSAHVAVPLTVGTSAIDHAHEQIVEALCARIDPNYKPDAKLAAGVQRWQHRRLPRMVEELARVQGIELGHLPEREIARMAITGRGMERLTHTSSDFPYLLASALNKVLALNYAEAPRTFAPWTRSYTTPDFKQISLLGLSEADDLVAIPEAGPFPLKSLSEAREVVTPAKYGHALALSWEMMINDDLGAFQAASGLIRTAALRLEESTVYGILNNNGNMRDAVALFHANHANLAGASAITPATIAELQGFIEVQTGLAGKGKLGLVGRYLIGTPGTLRKWDAFMSAQYKPTSASVAPTTDQMGLTPVASAHVSGTKYFLVCDPMQAPTVYAIRLQGYESPTVEEIDQPMNDSRIYKVRHVFAAKAGDWRGMAYNPGA